MVMAILGSLEHLHVRGVIHRDLKPANILMQGETPRLADFGLARLIGPPESSGGIAGTPAYMAPEVFDGKRSVRTDLWSAGVILHQLLAGCLPFPGKDFLSLMRAITSGPPDRLPASVPPIIQEVVARSLAKDEGARFATAADMRSALRDSLRQLNSEPLTEAFFMRRGCLTIAVTGSMQADRRRIAACMRTLAMPFCGPYTTWYCGTAGAVDEEAANFLFGQGQRVIAVGYDELDITSPMRALLDRFGAPFVDAQGEPVPRVPGAPSKRDIFFSSKADLLLLLWNGQSPGIAGLLTWLRQQGKDHVVGFV